MIIEVRFRALDASDALREHATRRVHFHLGRFADELSSVVVRISDVNGPRGGVDKRCQLTVRGARFGSSTLDELHDDPYAAVDLAMERLARVVERELARARGERRGGGSIRRAS